MKRDMELVRELLLIVESPEQHQELGPPVAHYLGADPAPLELQPTGFTTIPNKGGLSPILGHFELLIEAGLLRGEVTYGHPNFAEEAIVSESFWLSDLDLTWKGHEFLNTVRSPEVWRRTQTTAKKIGGASFEVLMKVATEIAIALAKQFLHLNPMTDPMPTE